MKTALILILLIGPFAGCKRASPWSLSTPINVITPIEPSRTYSRNQVRDCVDAICSVSLVLDDMQYGVPNHADFLRLINDEIPALAALLNQAYVAEASDCDNLADKFQEACNAAYTKAGVHVAMTVGVMKTTHETRIMGTKGDHAMIAAATWKDETLCLWILEPQGAINGVGIKLVPVSEYKGKPYSLSFK